MTAILPETEKTGARTTPSWADLAFPTVPDGPSARVRSPDVVRARRELEGVLGSGSGPRMREPEAARPRSPRSRKVTVLLPALNEEAAVGSVIDRIPLQELRHSGYDVVVCVVDGRSTDATLEIARGRGAQVFVQSGHGKGNGVRQALDRLTTGSAPGPQDPFYVMLDADGTYPPEQIHRLLDALHAGADVVLGSRFLGHIEDGAISDLNRLGNRALSRLAGFLFGVRVSDLCTGMWAFREGCLKEFGLAAEGFDLEADLYAAACFAEVRLAEVPVDYHRRIGVPKLIPLRTGLLIGWRLLLRRLNRPVRPRRRSGVPQERRSGEPA